MLYPLSYEGGGQSVAAHREAFRVASGLGRDDFGAPLWYSITVEEAMQVASLGLLGA